MNSPNHLHKPNELSVVTKTDRRQFVKTATALAGVSVAGSTLPKTFADLKTNVSHDSTIRLALIGCGNRGTGAVANALDTRDLGPIELYSMADLDKQNVDNREKLLGKFGSQINVSEDRKFIGFDAYKKAIDVLRPGDVAMCTTRAYIRPVHVEYAISQGINVFMEKPFSPDPVGLKRLLAAGKKADAKGIKVAAGLQCRHSPARSAMIDMIRDGAMGELSYVQADRLTGRRWMKNMDKKSNILMEQLKFGKINLFWVGSGHMVDNLIHQIDECCWLMNGWPVECHGMGGREVGSDDRGQNMDIYSMEYTFANGKKAICGFRRALKGESKFATYVHGSKCAGQFSGNVHAATVRLFKDHHINKNNVAWSPTEDAMSPWDYEWRNLVTCIREDLPLNETERACFADYASLMGRAAAHSNRTVTWKEITDSDFAFCANPDDLNEESEPPVLANPDGYFPAPHAGFWSEL